LECCAVLCRAYNCLQMWVNYSEGVHAGTLATR
jgi:hypothetical protein